MHNAKSRAFNFLSNLQSNVFGKPKQTLQPDKPRAIFEGIGVAFGIGAFSVRFSRITHAPNTVDKPNRAQGWQCPKKKTKNN